jgi:hypothetical protein
MTTVAPQSIVLKRHQRSLYLLAACIAILVLMFLLTVAKDLKQRQVLEAHFADSTQRADSRELLAPLLAELQGKSDASLPAVMSEDDVPLPDGDMSADNYEAIIGEIIRQCDLEQVTLMLDLQSILTNTDGLRVDLTTRGAFPDFRRLILALGRLPFLSTIEAFRIEESADAGMLEMFLQLRLQLESSVVGGHEHQ